MACKYEWKDVTSYSQGGSREPNAWTCKLLPGFSITVMCRHRDYPGKWVLYCHAIGAECILPVSNLEDAKGEAVQVVWDRLQKWQSVLSELAIEMRTQQHTLKS